MGALVIRGFFSSSPLTSSQNCLKSGRPIVFYSRLRVNFLTQVFFSSFYWCLLRPTNVDWWWNSNKSWLSHFIACLIGRLW